MDNSLDINNFSIKKGLMKTTPNPVRDSSSMEKANNNTLPNPVGI